MELTILTKFSQIHYSEISLLDLMILMNFYHFYYWKHFWTVFLDN